MTLCLGRGGYQQEQQAKLWKTYIEYEKGNSQRLEPDALKQRVALAYDQALMCLWHFPEMWYDFARWHADAGGGPEQATAILTKALQALPGCLMLHFALADMEEAQGQIERAKQVRSW